MQISAIANDTLSAPSAAKANAAAVWVEQGELEYSIKFMQQMQDGKDTYWQEPTIIADSQTFISNPVLIQKPNGNHLVFWVDNAAAPALIYFSEKSNSDARWSKPASISAVNSDISSISAVLDQNQDIHLFWIASNDQQDDLFMASLQHKNNKWSTISQVNAQNTDYEMNPLAYLTDKKQVAIRWQTLGELGEVIEHVRIIDDTGELTQPNEKQNSLALEQAEAIRAQHPANVLPEELTKHTDSPGTASVLIYSDPNNSSDNIN